MSLEMNRFAVILCAGYGTRMYPLTKNRPKHLLPVGGKPALDYLIEEIMNLDEINDIYIVTNDRFIKHFIKWKTNWDKPMKIMGKSIHLINDGSTSNDNRLGVAKDLDLVFQQTPYFSEVLVLGGDNIPLFRLKEYWLSFLNREDHFVIALMDDDKDRLRRKGVLILSEENQVLRLYEKPTNPPSNQFCPLLYLLKSSAKHQLTEYLNNEGANNEMGNFVSYLSQVETVNAFSPDQGRLDIGDMESYKDADEIIKSLLL
jgi:glucose-1-phosphate thymidylyltransferase|tara:strand:- start:159 stop:935 length:777 start_codon:yes stop_codon:yes gene_type:complete